MIKMEKIETPNDPQKTVAHQFMVSADEPMRVEVLVGKNGMVIAHVYKGDKVDMEQSPVGAYDSTVEHENWEEK
jgi:hypothetical protein